MKNSKAGCSQSKKKLQMNKDYSFVCIYHPFLLSIQTQSVIKSLKEKKHFYLVSIIVRSMGFGRLLFQ